MYPAHDAADLEHHDPARTPARTSIVIPCFNEADCIVTTLGTLGTWFGDAVDIIVVDDGSSDDTEGRVRAWVSGHPNVRAHRLAVNRGKGGALRAAIPLVTGERVLFLDADLVFDRTSVMAVLEALSDADMVVANRRHRESRYSVQVKLFGFLYRRHVAGVVFNAFVRMLLQVGLRDTQCGLKGFRREALQLMSPLLTTNGFALDLELILAARGLGLRIADVPVLVRYGSALSSVRLLGSGASMFLELLRIAARRAAGAYSARALRGAAASAAPQGPTRGHTDRGR